MRLCETLNAFDMENSAAFLTYSEIGMPPGLCMASTPSSEWCLVLLKLTSTGVLWDRGASPRSNGEHRDTCGNQTFLNYSLECPELYALFLIWISFGLARISLHEENPGAMN